MALTTSSRAVERTLRAKEQDLDELVLMSHDANHAKELSKADLLRVERREAPEALRERGELVVVQVQLNQPR